MYRLFRRLQAESEALADVQRQLRALQQEVAKKDGELQASLRDAVALRRANKEAEKEAADAKKHADAAQGKLDAETVARVDAENNLQSMKEDMEFKQQLFEKVCQQTGFTLLPWGGYTTGMLLPRHISVEVPHNSFCCSQLCH